jgi:hypothetical protein
MLPLKCKSSHRKTQKERARAVYNRALLRKEKLLQYFVDL